jgi:hypothetical protein
VFILATAFILPLCINNTTASPDLEGIPVDNPLNYRVVLMELEQ